jgi:hypothetical protein
MKFFLPRRPDRDEAEQAYEQLVKRAGTEAGSAHQARALSCDCVFAQRTGTACDNILKIARRVILRQSSDQ